MNTWSNLAFVWVGAFLFSALPVGVPRQSGLALMGVGVGSFLYHASASRVLRHADVAGMYWVYACVVLLAVGAVRPGFRLLCARGGSGLLVGLPLVGAIVTVFRNWRLGGWKPFEMSLVTGLTATVGVLALLFCAWTESNRRNWGLFVLTVVLFGIAVGCQIGDRPGGWPCNPTAAIQAHSLWHVLGALACGLTCFQLAQRWSESLVSAEIRPRMKLG
jgi:hypothetical protein